MKRFSTACLFLMACSGSGGGGGVFRVDLAGGGQDLRMGGNDMAVSNKPDMAMGPDLAMGGGMCTAEPDYGALGSKKGSALEDMDGSGNQVFLWEAPVDNQALPTVLSVQLYGGAGAFKGSSTVKTGTYQIAGDELNYATCGVCVLLYTKVDAMNMGFADSYLATGGTVKITSVNGNLAATLTGITFEHVQIDPDTYESTPDPSMCTSKLASLSFSDPIM